MHRTVKNQLEETGCGNSDKRAIDSCGFRAETARIRKEVRENERRVERENGKREKGKGKEKCTNAVGDGRITQCPKRRGKAGIMEEDLLEIQNKNAGGIKVAGPMISGGWKEKEKSKREKGSRGKWDR